MKKNKKIKVSWAFGNPIYFQLDFGSFSAHAMNQIEVDEEFWNKYCDIRFQFEVMQKELMTKIGKKGRDKIGLDYMNRINNDTQSSQNDMKPISSMKEKCNKCNQRTKHMYRFNEGLYCERCRATGAIIQETNLASGKRIDLQDSFLSR